MKGSGLHFLLTEERSVRIVFRVTQMSCDIHSRFPVAVAVVAALAMLGAGTLYSQPQRGVLYAGASKVDITPDTPVALAGYSNPETRISEGIHDRLYARTVAFRSGSKRLVLVSCDLSGFGYAPAYYFQKEIYARYNLKPDELILCGTHTHSGPLLFLSKVYPHPNNYTYTEGLRAKLVEAVGKALNATVPARLAAGAGRSDVAVNRRVPIPEAEVKPGGDRVTMGRNPEGAVDREVLVLKVAGRDGSPIASVFDYACHSRSLRAANKLVSGDILGIAEQIVEKAIGSNVVSPVFAGASGDVDPWYVVPAFDEADGRVSETVQMATSLGEEAVRVFRDAVDLPRAAEVRSVSERLQLPGKHAPKSLEMVAASVGDVAFLSLGCEVLVEIGKAIKAGSPFRHTFILTNCNGAEGYLPPAHLYPERGYEVDLSGFAPEAAGMVVQSALRMLALLRK